MRRIPRPSRAIDPSVPLHSATRPRLSPPSGHAAALPSTHVGAAAFSTTPSTAFLLSGKQDKKKHQQFVRRWQKRLLGDSEPIGAHVDPYDPTSPVRIAPEEQGEYEEVFEEDVFANAKSPGYKQSTHVQKEGTYKPAKNGGLLMHVGGEVWVQQKLERDMAVEFEKLTMQTYTPLSLDMANDIESLTGTPYTLLDDNLMMAQTVHEVTNRPYTKYQFGLHSKVKSPQEMRRRFTQAVAEVYALKEAGMDMDLAKLPNRGIYDLPQWAHDIKLRKTAAGKVVLAYPEGQSAKSFVRAMHMAPEWESTLPAEDEVLVNGEDEMLVDGADLLEPVLPAEAVPVMDPATPAFKKAAVVKIDPEKKPFDFMSNRPVPRTKPAEAETAEAVVEVVEETPEAVTLESSQVIEPVLAPETSQPAPSKVRPSAQDLPAQQIADHSAKARRSTPQKKPSSPAAPLEEAKWRHVPLTDAAVKFALFKRIFQLTGIRISDTHLTSANTIGHMYDYLCTAAKPQPTALFSAIHMQGQKARQRAKENGTVQETARRRADLGDLINLGNVEIRKVKPDKSELRTKKGMSKVIDYALWERGLSGPLPPNLRKSLPVSGGKRDVPGSAKPVSLDNASHLLKRTRSAQNDIGKVMQ